MKTQRAAARVRWTIGLIHHIVALYVYMNVPKQHSDSGRGWGKEPPQSHGTFALFYSDYAGELSSDTNFSM